MPTAGEVSRAIWWHYLVINIPDEIEFEDTGFLYITGGSNTNGYLIIIIAVNVHNTHSVYEMFAFIFLFQFACGKPLFSCSKVLIFFPTQIFG